MLSIGAAAIRPDERQGRNHRRINYLSGLGVNSMYFLTMKSHGDGKKAWPWPARQLQGTTAQARPADVVFSHMDRMGMMLPSF
jgi:hypothetical protein